MACCIWWVVPLLNATNLSEGGHITTSFQMCAFAVVAQWLCIVPPYPLILVVGMSLFIDGQFAPQKNLQYGAPPQTLQYTLLQTLLHAV